MRAVQLAGEPLETRPKVRNGSKLPATRSVSRINSEP